MRFQNLTPLPCLAMEARTPDGDRRQVVIARATLDLVPLQGRDRAGGRTHLLRLAQDQLPLACADEPWGPPGRSSLRWESDLAPAKPRCDLVVLGTAHAPGGRPRRRFPAVLRLRRPARGEVLLDHALRVTGPRWLCRRGPVPRILGWLVRVGSLGMVRPCPWKLTAPEAALGVPLRYEFSFGGHWQVRPGDPAFSRLPRRHWRPDVADREQVRAAAPDGAGSVLAEAWWEGNPVGRGYAPRWLLKAGRIRRLPAPQIEDPRHPFTARAFLAASRGRGPVPRALEPAGMGVVTRRWALRLRHAGTWHEGWAAAGAPYLPGFQEAFWNAAHPDLQIPHLEGDEVLELVNLCAPGSPGLGRDAQGNGLLRAALPGLAPYLLLEGEDGSVGCEPLKLDTVAVEPDQSRVTLVHRASFPAWAGSARLGLALPGPAAGAEEAAHVR